MADRRWDGRPRRSTDFDNGKVKDDVVLAVIAERVNTLIDTATTVGRELAKHKEDDNKQFTGLKVIMAGASGGLAVIVFLIDHFIH